MGRSKTKAEERGCIKHDGREYVSQGVAAQRLGIRQQTMSDATKAGKYHRQKIEGYAGMWYDWEVTRATFARLRKNPKKGGSRQKKDARIFDSLRKAGDVKTPPVPTEGSIDVGMPELSPKDTEILSFFDPDDPKNADCWDVDDYGEFMMIPNTDPPRHYVNWKKAIDKGLANIRYQQYMEKKGDLIPKTEVVQMLSKIFPPITAVLMQMPDKYASRINGRVEEMIGRPMTNEEVTIIKSILVDEAEKICKDLQSAIEEVTDDADD